MVVGDLSKLSDIRAQSTIFLHINTPSNLVGLYFMKSIWGATGSSGTDENYSGLRNLNTALIWNKAAMQTKRILIEFVLLYIYNRMFRMFKSVYTQLD